jgi:hypothetical protein
LIRGFEKQSRNDRQYYARNIKRTLLTIANWSDYTTEQRKQLVLAERERLINLRDKSFNMGTTRTSFPREHDEEAEIEWLEELFQYEIEHGRGPSELTRGMGRAKQQINYQESDTDTSSDQDGDDEEPLPQQKIKAENQENDTDSDDEKSDSGLGKRVVKQTSSSKGKVEPYSLSLRVQEGAVKPTKAYWGFNSKMEMVLIEPEATEGNGLKRRAEAGEEGESKKTKF